jgi:hypothetical protein
VEVSLWVLETLLVAAFGIGRGQVAVDELDQAIEILCGHLKRRSGHHNPVAYGMSDLLSHSAGRSSIHIG